MEHLLSNNSNIILIIDGCLHFAIIDSALRVNRKSGSEPLAHFWPFSNSNFHNVVGCLNIRSPTFDGLLEEVREKALGQIDKSIVEGQGDAPEDVEDDLQLHPVQRLWHSSLHPHLPAQPSQQH